MSPSKPCQPSRAMNPLAGDSERHLRSDTAALGSTEGPCPQRGLGDILAVPEGHKPPQQSLCCPNGGCAWPELILHRGAWALMATVPLGVPPPSPPSLAAAPKPPCLLHSGMGRGEIPKSQLWFVHLGKER